jgi:hypothetical protein
MKMGCVNLGTGKFDPCFSKTVKIEKSQQIDQNIHFFKKN